MKKFLIIIMSLLIFSSISGGTVLATDCLVDDVTAYNIQTPNSTRMNETVWIERTYNGKRQKRLWSYTYQCWMTDWIDID